MSDQAAFLKAIAAVPPTIQSFGGHYIVLGGKITSGEGTLPRRTTVIAFDNMEKAQQWFNSPVAAAARTEAQKFAKWHKAFRWAKAASSVWSLFFRRISVERLRHARRGL
jgi:uncharacterized protein (DUF1330 family)